MRDPIAHRAESFGDETVATLPAVSPLGYKSGIEQDAEVLRNGRPAHLEMSRNRVDGAVGLDQEIEHPATRGMADRSEHIGLAIGSHHHVAIIRKKTLTRQVRSGPCHLARAGPS